MRVWDPRKRSQKMRENYICRLQRFFQHACMLIRTRIRKYLRVWDEDTISFTSMGALFKGTVARDFCIKLRLWGVRLGHTDVTHPLLTSVYCPFNLLRLFKEGTHWSKTDIILVSNTHTLCVRVWDPQKRSQKMRENNICRLQRLFRHAYMLIRTRKYMRVWDEDTISFTLMGALFKRS